MGRPYLEMIQIKNTGNLISLLKGKQDLMDMRMINNQLGLLQIMLSKCLEVKQLYQMFGASTLESEVVEEEKVDMEGQ